MEGCFAEYGGGRQCTDGRALYNPTDVVVSKDGKQVYALSGYDSAVAVLQRER